MHTKEEIEFQVNLKIGSHRLGNFPAMLHDYIGRGEVILSFNIDQNLDTVMVVTEHYGQYSVLRFFQLGNKWNISYDLQRGNVREMTDLLIKNYKV
jgi:hypothetical protein